jgi:excisionase family DNA binding protein
MGNTNTAQELFEKIKGMPEKERLKLFALILNRAFKEQDNYSYSEVFGHLKADLFSARDAAKYLEISIPTLRRLVQSNKLLPQHTIGRTQLFKVEDLRILKHLKSVK